METTVTDETVKVVFLEIHRDSGSLQQSLFEKDAAYPGIKTTPQGG
jgi:hypothetical protein